MVATKPHTDRDRQMFQTYDFLFLRRRLKWLNEAKIFIKLKTSYILLTADKDHLIAIFFFIQQNRYRHESGPLIRHLSFPTSIIFQWNCNLYNMRRVFFALKNTFYFDFPFECLCVFSFELYSLGGFSLINNFSCTLVIYLYTSYIYFPGLIHIRRRLAFYS